MKIIKFSRGLFFTLALLFGCLFTFLAFTGNSYRKMRAIGCITEDLISDILFVISPLLMGIAALAAFIVIVKRCYGRKRLMLVMAIMFICFSGIAYLARGIDTNRIMRELESPDGKHMLYYVQERNDYLGTDWMRVYRRTGFFTYDAVFSVDNDKTDLIKWDDNDVEYNGKIYEYSSY